MKTKVHIYIATTKGLVRLQNITLLDDVDIDSVVTINGTSNIANISSGYHRFVDKSSGIITAHFGGKSYRLNLSANIDQGDSWQLGVYLGHLFDSQNQLAQHIGSVSLGEGNVAGHLANQQDHVAAQDVVLCITGAISTHDNSVQAVAQIEQKCIAAQGQVSHWQSHGILVQFLLPQQNIQEVPSVFTAECLGISTLKQCGFLLQHNGILQQVPDVLRLQSHKTSNAEAHATDLHPTGLDGAVSKQQTHAEVSPTAGVTAFLFRRLLLLKRSTKLGLIGIVSVFVMVVLLNLFWSNSVEPSSQYIATLSDNKACDASSFFRTSTAPMQAITILPPLPIDKLCDIALLTPSTIQSVWLVSDTGALLQLRQLVTTDTQQKRWVIPLPKETRIQRTFVLVSSAVYLDMADADSLSQFILQQMQLSQRPFVALNETVRLDDISTWFVGQSYEVNYYLGTLSK